MMQILPKPAIQSNNFYQSIKNWFKRKIVRRKNTLTLFEPALGDFSQPHVSMTVYQV